MNPGLLRIVMTVTLMALVGCSASLSPTPAATVVLMQPPHVQTVNRSWTTDELLARRATEGAPVWADGDELTFFYQGEADEVHICCGIQMPMRRIQGTDLWVLTVRIRDLSRAAIGYTFIPYQDGRPVLGAENSMEGMQQWRGPESPPAPQRATTLQGRIERHDLDSEALGEQRGLTVYLPPGYDPNQRLPVVYAADGDLVRRFAATLDPLIVDGSIPPVIVVGVHAAPIQATTEHFDPSQDLRAQEYLPGFNQERFKAHERFFVYEVADWAEKNLGVTTDREQRTVFGVSNGGGFAVAMGIRHPERYANVLAFSLAGGPAGPGTPEWTADMVPRHYLVAGTLEPFREPTAEWAAELDRLGVEHVYRERVCGHDAILWEEEFPGAIAWTFANR